MSFKNVFSFLLSASLILTGAQQIHAQTYKTGRLSEAIQIRERLFKERQRLEQHSPDSKLLKSGSTEKILVSDGQIVYRYVSALAISPNFEVDNIIMAAVANEGLYISKNKGTSWEQILKNTRINCVAFSPNYSNDKTILVGAGSLYKTEDDGDNWEVIKSFITYSIEFSPNYLVDSTFYVNQGISYSVTTDLGKSFRGMTKPQPLDRFSTTYPIYDIRVSPTFSIDSIMYISSEVGYFKSMNGGNQWEQLFGLGDLFSPTPVDRITFYPPNSSSTQALAGTYLGLYQISREDSVWQPSDPTRVILAESVSEIIFSPEFEKDQTIYVGTAAGIFKSTDGGLTWTAENRGLTDLNIETFAMSPNFVNDHFLAVGTHDGVFISDTPQIAWKPRNSSLPTSFGVKNLSKDPYTLNHNPRIVSSKDDALHVFWKGIHFSETKGDLVNDTYYQKRIAENGQTVKLPTPIEGFAWGSFEVDADKDGFVHLLLSVGDNEQSNRYYTNNRSGDFTMHVFDSATDIDGDLKVDTNGFAHIIGTRGNGRHLFYSTNKSGQFVAVELSNLPEHSFIYGAGRKIFPNIQLDSKDFIHLFYPGRLPTFGTNLFYANNAGAGAFTEFINVANENETYGGAFFVLVDKMDAPHFVYTGSFNRGYYRRLIGDSLTSPISLSGGGTEPVIDASDKIHMGTGSYTTIQNEQISPTIYPLKGFPSYYLNTSAGPVITNEDIIHIVRSQRSNNIKSDFDFDVYLISFKSNSNSGHIAYGSLLNENGSVPVNDDIMFQAYIIPRSDEILTGNATGGGYKNGVWSVQCASFPRQWQVGDILHVDFTNTTTGQTASVEDTLTAADLDLFPITVFGQTTAVDESSQLPKQFHLSQNYPNPFNPETTIRYQLPKASAVKLEIYNLLGQRVATLVEKKQPEGDYAVVWNGKDAYGGNVASGVLLYRLQAGDFVKVRKLVLVR